MKKSFSVETFYFIIKIWHCRALVFSILLFLVNPLNAAEDAAEEGTQDTIQVIEEDGSIHSRDDYYIGVFVGPSKMRVHHEDPEGFANWGNPGSVVDYEDKQIVGGLLIGKKLRINGVTVRVEIDGTVGNMSARTDELDPIGRDETGESRVKWLVTLRAGLEKRLGLATVFASAGPALARVSDSVIDIDFGPDHPPYEDLDDSFSKSEFRLGWAAGLGVEVPLNQQARRSLLNDGAWVLRMEGSYVNLGEKTYRVNHSGNNRCGADGPRRPCFYNIENEVGFIRLAIIRRFSL